jgi:hypothetical protein
MSFSGREREREKSLAEVRAIHMVDMSVDPAACQKWKADLLRCASPSGEMEEMEKGSKCETRMFFIN